MGGFPQISSEDINRYSRQLMIPEIGLEGQKKLIDAEVLVVGAGGLGCPILIYLAAAGVGTIGIADYDQVDISNLQRQILFNEKDLGQGKVASAAAKLVDLNSGVKINKISQSISIDNVLDLISNYDIVIDACDNFLTRYILSDACALKSIPLVYGSLFRLEGQLAVFNLNDHSPCYRCLYPSPPPRSMIPSCSEGGALGSVAGVIGTLQATECLKIILNTGNILSEKILNLNLLDLDFSILTIKKSASCAVCTQKNFYQALNPEWYEFESLNHICSKIKNITNQDLLNALNENNGQVTLINVKESWENTHEVFKFQEIYLPLSLIEKDMKSIIGKISHKGKNVFYCNDGSRSDYAVSIIEKELGFDNLYSFKSNPHKLI